MFISGVHPFPEYPDPILHLAAEMRGGGGGGGDGSGMIQALEIAGCRFRVWALGFRSSQGFGLRGFAALWRQS